MAHYPENAGLYRGVVDTVAGCGWLHALPRSLRALPPSNVVRLFFVPPPSAGMMGIAATSTLEGGGARNTPVWGNLTLLISENTD